MERYSFHLDQSGSLTLDDDGREFPDLRTARLSAIADARRMMCDGVAAGTLCLAWHIDIVDAAGGLTRLSFTDAVAVTGR